MFVDLILIRRFTEPWQQAALLVLSVGLGIYFSVGVAKAAKRIGNKYVDMALGLK